MRAWGKIRDKIFFCFRHTSVFAHDVNIPTLRRCTVKPATKHYPESDSFAHTQVFVIRRTSNNANKIIAIVLKSRLTCGTMLNMMALLILTFSSTTSRCACLLNVLKLNTWNISQNDINRITKNPLWNRYRRFRRHITFILLIAESPDRTKNHIEMLTTHVKIDHVIETIKTYRRAKNSSSLRAFRAGTYT